MRLKKRILALALCAFSVVSALSPYSISFAAEIDNQSAEKTEVVDKASNIENKETNPVTTPDVVSGNLSIKIDGKNGTVALTNPISNEKIEIESNSYGKLTVTTNGVKADANVSSDGSCFEIKDLPVGTVIPVEVNSKQGYHVETFSVTTDSGSHSFPIDKKEYSIVNGKNELYVNFKKDEVKEVPKVQEENSEEQVEPSVYKLSLKSIGEGSLVFEGNTSEEYFKPYEKVTVYVAPEMEHKLIKAVLKTSEGHIIRNLSVSSYPLEITMPKCDSYIEATFEEYTYEDKLSDSKTLKNSLRELGSIGFMKAAKNKKKTEQIDRLFVSLMATPSSVNITPVSSCNYKDFPGFYAGSGIGMPSSVFSSDGTTAFCIDPMVNGVYSSTNYNTSNASIYEVTDPQILNTLYHSYGNPGDLTGSLASDGNARNIISHVALSKLANVSIGGFSNNQWNASASGNLQNLAQQLIDMSNASGIPNSIKVHAYVIDPNAKQQRMIILRTEPNETQFKIVKSSRNPSISNGNSCYSLKGAVYGLYRYSDNGLAATITTKNEAGDSDWVTVTCDNYYLKEITAPKGYQKDNQTYGVNLTSANPVTVGVSDMPGDDPIKLILSKRDSETNDENPLGGARLEGAEYTFKYYDALMTSDPAKSGFSPKRTWVFKTDKNGKINLLDSYKVSGDSLYVENGTAVLPIGTLTIQESKAPNGYLLNDTVYVVKTDIANGLVTTTNLPNAETRATKEQVMRADFKLRKLDANTLKEMSDIPFKITNIATGESHTFTTDENGEFSSESSYALHSHNTNKGGVKDGLWFGMTTGGKIAPVNDKMGALPFGKYKIEELRCEKNEKKVLWEDVLTINKDKWTVDLRDILNLDKPNISSHIYGDFTPKPYSQVALADGNTVITDRVDYKRLTSKYIDENGEEQYFEYKMVGSLYDKSTGKLIKKNGEDYKVEKKFKAYIEDDYIVQDFVIDSTGFDGKNIVCYENLYIKVPTSGEWKLLASHEDPNDENQTLFFPKVTSKLTDASTGTHVGVVGKDVTLTDKVMYTGFEPEWIYTVKDNLIDKSTGKVISSVEQTFKSEGRDGEIEFAHKIDSSSLKGKDVVATVEVKVWDHDFAKETDLENKSQTVHFPETSTKAHDKNTESRVGCARKTTIIDKVNVSNILDGYDVTVKGYLVDQDSKEVLKDKEGNVYAAEETFNISNTSEVTLSYPVDCTGFEGRTIVCCADIYINGVLVTSHNDLTDENETIRFVYIHTEARDAKSGTHSGVIGSTGVYDRVYYSNLVPGKTYTLNADLHSVKSGGKVVSLDGVYMSGERTFKATKEEGSVDVYIPVRSKLLKGESVVVYEYLSYKDEEIAHHTDRYEKKQTVNYPGMGTVATVDGSHYATPSKKTVLKDRVFYRNLVPGKKYHEEAVLMDKETGKPVLINGGEVKTQLDFVPNTKDGYVDIEFKFDSRTLEEHTVVVFEHMYDGKTLLTSHADINDEGQSVHFSKKPPRSPKTGFNNSPSTFNKLTPLAFIIAFLSLILFIFTVRIPELIENRNKVCVPESGTEKKRE